MSTGSEAFPLLIRLGATRFVLLSVFTLIETIYLNICAQPLPKYEKCPLPVDVGRSKTALLKLPSDNTKTSFPGLSSSPLPGYGKTRDPGNEVDNTTGNELNIVSKTTENEDCCELYDVTA